jgi:hypothetical protein
MMCSGHQNFTIGHSIIIAKMARVGWIFSSTIRSC